MSSFHSSLMAKVLLSVVPFLLASDVAASLMPAQAVGGRSPDGLGTLKMPPDAPSQQIKRHRVQTLEHLAHTTGMDFSVMHGAVGSPVVIQGCTGASNLAGAGKLEAALRGNSANTWLLSALLGHHYASLRGYSYMMWSYKDVPWAMPGACKHPLLGEVRSHWCKPVSLLAALEYFKESNTFFWLDTDAYVRDMSVPVTDYVRSARHCAGRSVSHPPVMAWQNGHWGGCRTACNGALVIERSESWRAILENWAAMEERNKQHDQPGFNIVTAGNITVFSDNPFSDELGQFLTHRCGSCDWMPSRQDMAEKVMKENSVTLAALEFVLPNMTEWVRSLNC